MLPGLMCLMRRRIFFDSIEYLIPYAVGNRMDTIFESKKAAQ